MRRNLIYTTFKYCLLLFLFASCNTDKKEAYYKGIDNYFQTNHEFNITDSIKAVFVLTEQNCMPCNKKLSEFRVHNNNKELVYLIKASGSAVDISPYENMQGNIFYSYDDTPLFKESQVILLNNKSIDTVIKVNAKTIYDDLDFISKKIKSD